jgi:hypothetical protein
MTAVCWQDKTPLPIEKGAGVKAKKNPAYAVYCQVLNLQLQVGPYLETPPWLRPIALFLIKLRTPLLCIGSEREDNITHTAGL